MNERSRTASALASVYSLLMDLEAYVETHCERSAGVISSSELLANGLVHRDLSQGQYDWAFELEEEGQGFLLLSGLVADLSLRLRQRYQLLPHPSIEGSWRIGMLPRASMHVPELAAAKFSETGGIGTSCFTLQTA